MNAVASESILEKILKMLGIEPENQAFDEELVMHINGVFSELYQLGVGPEEPYSITGRQETWGEFITSADLNLVISYVWLETRLMFDPPTASLLTSFEKRRDEYEWRLNVAADRPLDRNEDQNDTDD